MEILSKVVSFTEESKEEVLRYIKDILDSGNLTLGKYTKLLEDEIKRTVCSKFVVAVNSGTSALEIILRIINVKGKKVLVPSNTFAATIFAIIHAGGIPVFVDTINGNGNSGIEEYLNKIDCDTKVAIPVHIGGEIYSELPQLVDEFRKKKIYLVEDCAHALGSYINHKHAGTFGIAGAFSLYPTKVVTSGEGGFIVTDDELIYRQILILRDQGKENFNNNYSVKIGYNWRMSELNAALGYAHIKTLSSIVEHRNLIAKIYNEGLKNIKGIKIPFIQSNNICNYYKYIVYFESEIDLDDIKLKAKKKYGFNFSGEVYKVPCHLQPAFMKYTKNNYLPSSEIFCKNHLSLPMYNSLTLQEAKYIIASFRELIRNVLFEVGEYNES